MAVLCINKNSKEYKDLSKKLADEHGVEDYVVETLVYVYNDMNGIDLENPPDTGIIFPGADFVVRRLKDDPLFNMQEAAKNYGIHPKQVKEIFPDQLPKDALYKVGGKLLADQYTNEVKKFHLEFDKESRLHKKMEARLNGRTPESLFQDLNLNTKYSSDNPLHWLQRIVKSNKEKFGKFYNQAIGAKVDSKLDLKNEQSVRDYFTNPQAKFAIKLYKELKAVNQRLYQYFRQGTSVEDERLEAIRNQLENMQKQLDFREFDLGTINFLKDFFVSLEQMKKGMKDGIFRTPRQIAYLGEFISFYKPMFKDIKAYLENREEFTTEKDAELRELVEFLGDEFGDDFVDRMKGFSYNDQIIGTVDTMIVELEDLKTKQVRLSRQSTLDRAIRYIKENITDPKIQQQEIDKAREFIANNDYDDNMGRSLFGTIAKSKDVFLRIFHAIMRRVNLQVSNFTLDLGQEVYQKAKDLGVDLSTIGSKVTDPDSPHDFITEYDWKTANDKAQEEFEDLNRSMGLPENKDLAKEERRMWQKEQEAYDYYSTYEYNQTKEGKRIDKTKYIVKKGSNISIQSKPEQVPDAEWEMTIENYLKSDAYINMNKSYKYSQAAQAIYKKYYVNHPEAKKIINRLKKKWGENSAKYKFWHSENVGVKRNGETYYKGDLLVPKDKNKHFNKLTKNEKEFLDYLLSVKEEADYKIPFSTRLYRKPQIKSSFINSVFKKKNEKGMPDIMRGIREGFNFIKDADDTDFGNEPTRRADGSIARSVPTHFIEKVADPKALTNDVVGSIIMYAQMAENARLKMEIQPEYESLLDTIGNRETTLKGNRPVGRNTNTYRALENFVESQVFGMFKTSPDQDVIRIFGKEFSVSKLMLKFSNYIRNNNLAFRFSTAFVGAISSTVNFNLEKLVGMHVSKGTAKRAMSIYKDHAVQALKESGKVKKTNKLSRMLQSHYVMQETEQMFSNLDFITQGGRKFATDQGFLIYSFSEHGIKSNAALSTMLSYRLYNGEFVKQDTLETLGVEWQALPTYWDALDSDGKSFRHEVKDPKKERENMQMKINYLINDIDGKINPEDRAAAHRHYLGQFLTIHRNWLLKGIDKRFHKEGFNYETGMMEEGYYTTSLNFVRELFGERITSLKHAKAKFKELDKHQQQAVKRTMYESLLTAMMITFVSMLNYLSSEDEEEGPASFALDYMAFLMTRTYIEFTTLQITPSTGIRVTDEGVPTFSFNFVPPIATQLTEVIKSPVTGTQQLETFADIARISEWGEPIESGPYEGMTRGMKVLFKSIPGGKGITSDLDPEASRKFLESTTLRW